MNAIASPPLMTAEEFLALPDDGIERALIRGRLREYGMTRRNRMHSGVTIRLGRYLDVWLDGLPEPRGQILGGGAGFLLGHDPDSSFGIDIAYISPELAAASPKDAFLIEGAPVLAVEILSPSNTDHEIAEKIASYLEAGVAVVWKVSPSDQTVTVYRRDNEPEMFNRRQELAGDPELPGFRLSVAKIFA